MPTVLLQFECECGHKWPEEFFVDALPARIDFKPPKCPNCGNEDAKKIQQHAI